MKKLMIVALLIVLLLSVSDVGAADCGKCLSVRIARAEKAESAPNFRPPGGYVPFEFACGPNLVCETR